MTHVVWRPGRDEQPAAADELAAAVQPDAACAAQPELTGQQPGHWQRRGRAGRGTQRAQRPARQHHIPGSCRTHARVQPVPPAAAAAAAGGTARWACPAGWLPEPPAAAQSVPVNHNSTVASNSTSMPVSAQGGMPPIIRGTSGKSLGKVQV